MKISKDRIIKIIEKHKFHFLIFGVALFLILACTVPKIFLNDEWITTNQLSQIDKGHQVIIDEGKYGTFANGTLFKYFEVRDNRLGYTIFLPLISLPALKCINFFGNSFLFFLVEFWTILLIAISLFVRQFFPEYSGIYGYNWTNFTIIAAFGLFFCNLVFYQPFLFIGKGSHPEIAAIALTNAVLLAALAVLLYATYFTIFKSYRISLSAAIISICCSSYIFWMTSAKDHMLVAFLFGVLIYCGIKYIYTDNRWYVPAFFMVIGWIAWARAEIAVPLFGVFLILVIIKCIKAIKTERNVKAGLFFLLVPVFTFIGAIPLFINDYFLTGNPLIPPFVVFNQKISTSVGTEITHSFVNILPAVPGNVTIIQNGVPHFFDVILSMYTIGPETSIFDLLKILFLPGTVNIGIFVLCPVLIIGLALAVLMKIRWSNFSPHEKSVTFFLIVVAISIFIAYIHSLSGMFSDFGIAPDVRYLSPVYLPCGILGVILIQKCRLLPIFSKKGLSVLLFSMSEIILILITFMILFKPADKSFQFYVSTVSETITCITFAMILLCILSFIFIRNIQHKTEYCSLILYAVVGIPLIWQLAMIFNSNICINYDGYTYWIPVVKFVMQHLQDFIV
jgi:hypothetical protein